MSIEQLANRVDRFAPAGGVRPPRALATPLDREDGRVPATLQELERRRVEHEAKLIESSAKLRADLTGEKQRKAAAAVEDEPEVDRGSSDSWSDDSFEEVLGPAAAGVRKPFSFGDFSDGFLTAFQPNLLLQI